MRSVIKGRLEDERDEQRRQTMFTENLLAELSADPSGGIQDFTNTVPLGAVC